MRRYNLQRMRNLISTLFTIILIILPELVISTQYSTLTQSAEYVEERNSQNIVQFLRTPGTPTYYTSSSRGSSQQSEMINVGGSQTWTMDADLSSDTVVDDIYSRVYLQGPMPTPIRIDGTDSDQAGFNISADDINNDGISDIIVGAPYEEYGTKTNCGAANIFFGSSTFAHTPPDPKITKNDADAVIFGENDNDNFGWSVSGANDVNGDDYNDIIVGAPHYSTALPTNWANYLVISEVQLSGVVLDDEFIELYNPTNTQINVVALGLCLHICDQNGVDNNKPLSFIRTTIDAYGYYLIGSLESYSGTESLDATYSTAVGNTLVPNGGCYVSTSPDVNVGVIDKVGFGSQPSCFEGTPVPTNPPASASVERLPATTSSGNGLDINVNTVDFIQKAPSEPQNTLSATEPPSSGPSIGRAYVFYGGTVIGVGGTTTANNPEIVSSSRMLAQSFIPRADMTSSSGALLDKVRVYLAEGSQDPAEGVRFSIYADSNGAPSEPPLVVSDPIDPFTNPSEIEQSWVYWDLSPDIELAKDTKYWIVLSTNDVTGFLWFSWDVDKYPDGGANTNMGSWGVEDEYDRLFSIIPLPGVVINGERAEDCFGSAVCGVGEMGNGGSIFNDGFERGTTSWTSSSVSEGNSLSTVSNVYWYGKYSLKSTLGGSSSNAYLEKNYETSNFPTHYLRFYFMLPEGFTISEGKYWNLASVVDSAGNTRFVFYIVNIGNELKIKGNSYDNLNQAHDIGLHYPTTGSLSLERWYCVENKIKVSSSAGEVSAWVEGNLESSNTITNTGTTGINIKYIRLGSVGSTSSISGSVYFDHIGSSTLPIGLGYLDFSVGAPFNDNSNKTNNGRVYVFLGNSTSSWKAKTPMLASSADVIWNGEMKNGYFGFSLGYAGNVNGDAFDEAIAGAPGCDRAYVYYGSAGLSSDQGSYTHTTYEDFFAQTRLNIEALTSVQDAPDGGACLEDLGGTKYKPNNVENPDFDGVPDYYLQNSGSRANTQETWPADSQTWDISESNVPTNSHALTDIPVVGTVEGSYLNTHNSDDSYESITENLSPTYVLIWSDGFETDKGWTGYGGTGEWQRGTPSSTPSTPTYGRADPSSAYSGSKILGVDIGVTTADNGTSNGDGLYPNSITTPVYITSPAINCSGRTGIALTFWRWLNIEGSTFDYPYVEVSKDGSSWTVLYPLASNPRVTDGAWSLEVYNISSVADNQGTVYIRFGYKSDGSYQFTGWNIDEVAIYGECKADTYTTSLGGTAAWQYYGTSATDPPSTGPEIGTQDTTYTATSASDDTRWNPNSVKNTYLYRRFKFTINDTSDNVVALTFSIENYGSAYVSKVYIWNYTSSAWNMIGLQSMYPADTDMHGSVTNVAHYISSTRNVNLLVTSYSDNSADNLFVDYVYLRVLGKKPSVRMLEHKWTFSVTWGTTVSFYLEAYHTSGENFKFYYSTTGSGNVGGAGWTLMVTVTATSDPNSYQNYALPAGTSGTIYIGVIDEDRTSSDTTSNTLYIDHMYIASSSNPYYEVEFQITGLVISYTSVNIVFVGRYYGSESPQVFYRSGASWTQDTGISIGTSENTYESTTNVKDYISSDTLSIKLRCPGADANYDSGVVINWLGVKTSAPNQYASYGYILQSEGLVTVNPILHATATWDASGVTTQSSTSREIGNQGTAYNDPFRTDVTAYRIQNLYLSSELTPGYFDKIYFRTANTNTGTFGTTSFRIWLCNVGDKTTLTTDMTNTGNYNGYYANRVLVLDTTSLAFTGITNGWGITIDISNDFYYTGTGSVLMDIEWIGCSGSSVSTWVSNTLASRQAYDIGNNGGGTADGIDYVSYVKFDILTTINNFKVYLSRSNGASWVEVQSGVACAFSQSDTIKNNLLYKVEMFSFGGTNTPTLHSITISYETEIPYRTPTPLFGDSGTSFGWAVSGVGNTDNALTDDVFVGAPGYGSDKGRVYCYLGGKIIYSDYAWNDTSQSDFTSYGSNLYSENPNTSDNVYATLHGELTLRENLIANDDFESYTVGGEPTPYWTVTDTEDQADIDIANDIPMISGTKGVKISDTVTNRDAKMTRTLSPALTSGVVELYVNASSGWMNVLIIRSGGAFRAQIYVNNNYMRYYNGADHDLATNVYGRWFWLRLVFHTSTNTVDIYVDGNLTYSGSLANSGSIDTVEISSDSTGTGVAYIDDAKVYTYYTSGTYLSRTLSGSDYIACAKITWYADLQGQSVSFYLSRDNGVTWSNALQNNTEYWFTNSEPNGKELRYKVVMSTTDNAYSPMIYNVSVSYRYIKVGFTIDGENTGDKFGFSVSGGGNNVKDSYSDALIGAPNFNGYGAAYLFAGRAYTQGYAYDAETHSSGKIEGEHLRDMFGWSVYAGSVDATNNGGEELLIGAALYDSDDHGQVRIYESLSPGQIEIKFTYDTYPSSDPQLIGVTTHIFDANRWYLDFLNSLYGISSSSDDNFVAVGRCGIIYRYSGSPAKWDSISRVVNKDLYGVSLINVYGVAVGDGVILYTSTSGASWSVSTDTDVDSAKCYYGVSTVDFGGTKQAWAVASQGQILYNGDITAAGGGDWVLQTATGSELRDVEFYANAPSLRGICVGTGAIYYYSSGSWNLASGFDVSKTYYGVSTYYDASTTTYYAWAVGSNGAIYKSSDGGATWTLQSSGTNNFLRSVSFYDSNNGVAVGDKGTVIRTTDGGSNWIDERYGLDISNNLYAVKINSASCGFLVGSGSWISKTTDNGDTWSKRVVPSGKRISMEIKALNSWICVIYNGVSGGADSSFEIKRCGDARTRWVQTYAKKGSGEDFEQTKSWTALYYPGITGYDDQVKVRARIGIESPWSVSSIGGAKITVKRWDDTVMINEVDMGDAVSIGTDYKEYEYTFSVSTWSPGLYRAVVSGYETAGLAGDNIGGLDDSVRGEVNERTVLFRVVSSSYETRIDTSYDDFTAQGSICSNTEVLTTGTVTLLRNNIAYYTFNSDVSGGNPAGWTIEGTEGANNYIEVTTERYYGSSGKSVKIVDTTTSNSIGMYTTFSGVTKGSIVVCVYMNAFGRIDILPTNTAQAPDYPAMQIYFENDGKIYFYNGVTNLVQSYSTGTWYMIEVKFDTTTRKADVFVDGVLKLDDVNFLNSVANINKISINTDGNSATTSATYIDEVKVYTYPTSGTNTYTSAPTTISGNIGAVTVSFTTSELSGQPSGLVSTVVQVSRDGGVTWSPALTNGETYMFRNGEPFGDTLVYRFTMSTTDERYSPRVDDISLTYYFS